MRIVDLLFSSHTEGTQKVKWMRKFDAPGCLIYERQIGATA